MSDFIKKVAPIIQIYAKEYGIAVCSPIIAQAALESAHGASELAINANNFFGLKYRPGRCPSADDYYIKIGSEQNADGSYTESVMKWFSFPDMEAGVIGYFDFINNSNYANLKGVTDPETYLRNIKADGYATSHDYVKNLMNVIKKYNLTQYDKKEVVNMAKVAIDAGHGSNTAGKRTPDGYREHWINVKTAYYLEQALQKLGIQTVRIAWDDTNATDDTDVALATRQKQIKAAGCDYSVSVHANAFGNGSNYNSASGVSTHVSDKAAYLKDSVRFAQCIQKRIVQGTKQRDRGVVRQSLAMCNCPAMGTKASCLVEIAFMTHETEANLMKTEAFCKEQGEDIAKGIADYLGMTVQEAKPEQTQAATTAGAAGTNTGCPFEVKLLEHLNIRATPNGKIVIPDTDEKGARKGGVYTIVKVQGNWGYLKSGAGWISISSKYVKRI